VFRFVFSAKRTGPIYAASSYGYCCVLQEFEVLTTPINLEDIGEKIAMVIVSQIIDPKGEFHCPNKQ